MWQHIKNLKKRYNELENLLEVSLDLRSDQITELCKEYADLTPIISQVDSLESEIRELKTLNDLIECESGEMANLIRAEMKILKESIEERERKLKMSLLPKDRNDNRNIILEIRSGSGGEEAALFSLDLFRMYTKYAQVKRWKTEVLDLSSSTDYGGISRVEMLISGVGVYGSLKYESGVHRVQRVPVTESNGRLHTSAATVVVLPEAELVDVKISEKDIRVDTYRSQGAGGQHVNTTDSAVRITHIPTGIVVQCQDERSQLKNREKAMKILYTRIYDFFNQEQRAQEDQNRRQQIGSGDRSERIRTYNFPQGRLTDHRINFTLYKLESVLEGNLDEVIQALQLADNAEKLSKYGI